MNRGNLLLRTGLSVLILLAISTQGVALPCFTVRSVDTSSPPLAEILKDENFLDEMLDDHELLEISVNQPLPRMRRAPFISLFS